MSSTCVLSFFRRLVISIANLHLINTIIRIIHSSITDTSDKYLLRYFILHCIKEQSFLLSRLGLLLNSQLNDIETMINKSNMTIYNSLDSDVNYFKLIFSKYFEDLSNSDIFTISYPGDNNWIKAHIPAKL